MVSQPIYLGWLVVVLAQKCIASNKGNGLLVLKEIHKLNRAYSTIFNPPNILKSTIYRHSSAPACLSNIWCKLSSVMGFYKEFKVKRINLA